MKGFALVLLCALVAAQARHTGVEKSSTVAAALGENPWVVHLRLAVSTSGLLNTCVGTLIDSEWVLTAASCLVDNRFIWIRYGTINVINPELVTESSVVNIHPEFDAATGANNIGLIRIGRVVHSTDNISPITLADADTEVPSTATTCGFGENSSGGPGEELLCLELDVTANDDGSIDVDSSGNDASPYDLGAPLESDSVLIGLLTAPANDENSGEYTLVAPYLEWIEEQTGLTLSKQLESQIVPEVVKFVN